MRILIAHASRHGATAGIADHIAARLRTQGHAATSLPVQQATDVDDYDAVALGAAAYLFHWLKPAVRFARRHAQQLATKPLWLFSSGPLGTEQTDAHGVDVDLSTRPREWDALVPLLKSRGMAVFFGAYDPDAPPTGLAEHLIRLMPGLPACQPATSEIGPPSTPGADEISTPVDAPVGRPLT